MGDAISKCCGGISGRSLENGGTSEEPRSGSTDAGLNAVADVQPPRAVAQKEATQKPASASGSGAAASAAGPPPRPPQESIALTPQEREKIATEKAAADKVAAEKAAVEKAATKKAADEKAATEKAATETAADAQKAGVQKAAEDKAASEKAGADKAAAEKAGTDKAAAEKAATAKAAEEEAAAEKKAAAEKAPEVKSAADYQLPASYSLADVAKHSTKEDCWVILNGEVLDVTKFIPDHPGGDMSILSLAGKDASADFNIIHPPEVIKQYAPDAIIGKYEPTAADNAAAEKAAAAKVAEEKAAAEAEQVAAAKAAAAQAAAAKLASEKAAAAKAPPEKVVAEKAAAGNSAMDKAQLEKTPVVKSAADYKLPASSAGNYTLEDVAKHATKEDCWMVINGEVLDVTKFMPEHPGGDEVIMMFAGKDASDEFNPIHPPEVIKQYAPEAVIGKLGAAAVPDAAAAEQAASVCICCNGTGVSGMSPCPLCDGDGKVEEEPAGGKEDADKTAKEPRDTLLSAVSQDGNEPRESAFMSTASQDKARTSNASNKDDAIPSRPSNASAASSEKPKASPKASPTSSFSGSEKPKGSPKQEAAKPKNKNKKKNKG